MGRGCGRRYRRGWGLVCVAMLGALPGAGVAWAAGPIDEPTLATPGERQRRVELRRQASAAERTRAWATAKRQGWVSRGRTPRGQFELVAIRDGRVYVLATSNANAAISTAVDRVRQVSPYSLSGIGQTIGIWDGGAVRQTHQEFGGRVTVRDGASPADHATHVGGTIGASGVNGLALGMAPSVLIDSYEWTNDLAEMTSRAMALPGEAGRIQVSSHSYGFVVGWYGTRWYGQWPQRESEGFGVYDSNVADIDQLCHDAPYFLPFKSAGNDRSDAAPSAGTFFEYYNGGWKSKAYDPATDPYSDGWDNGGFDTIGHIGNAKNIVTVGAVNDAVSGGVRSLAAATMSSFSCWGPTDDGRIKPDVVANGVSLTSSFASSDSSYGIMSGTSMSVPNASGSAMLLLQYYGELFPGQSMRASTLKGLLIHTADDLDNAGPDYRTGWGLINVERAAELLKGHHDIPAARGLVEGVLAAGHPADAYEVSWNGEGSLWATLCWTDPPGTAMSALDDPTLRLVNDLDLRIIGPGGSPVYSPFVLDPASPASPATTGDNIRDNVEQVLVVSPVAGEYIIQITHKGMLAGAQQHYSLLVSGSGPGPAGAVLLDRTSYRCADQLAVTVMDGDLRGQGSQLVTVATNGGDAESVTCNESPAGSGVFAATLTVATGTVSSGDGILQVVDGQIMTAVYQDLDDGSGQPVAVQDQAGIDCVAPMIADIAVSGVTARQAIITFTTDEPSVGQVRYGLTCGMPAQTAFETVSTTTHEIILTDLTPEAVHHFVVEASDPAGNLAGDDNGGYCHPFTTLSRPDRFTEMFGTVSNDLAGRTTAFVPDGSSNFYKACAATATTFPVDPATATTLNLTDDASMTVTLGSGQVRLFGTAYASFHVGSNGFLTFDTGDTNYNETLAAHFSQPRVSALFDDLNPAAGGRVSWMELSDRAVVTFENVPEWGQSGGNSFQIEMFFDGCVRMTWLALAAMDGIAGLSPGMGMPADYVDSDLSAYGDCTHPGDFDGDADIDMDDIAWLQRCLSGSGINGSLSCENADLDGDGDVDAADMWLLRGCLSGAGLTADPECLP